MKTCRVCGQTKPLDDFYKSAGMADGHRHDCKVCNLAAKKARTALDPQANRDRVRLWQSQNAERVAEYQRVYRQRPERKLRERETYLLRTYGITLAEYDEMLEAQGGVCLVCKEQRPEERTLHVDHDHKTGKIRGLLCFRCNNAIGDLRENADLVLALFDYLERDEVLTAKVRERVVALRG